MIQGILGKYHPNVKYRQRLPGRGRPLSLWAASARAHHRAVTSEEQVMSEGQAPPSCSGWCCSPSA